ncbi:MAG TPA: serine hydrolase domain-containing protein, partial [Rhizomicrobium sp.]|nr:serine hydrolase domain-containing protein [Rhizomicrobium sp.]
MTILAVCGLTKEAEIVGEGRTGEGGIFPYWSFSKTLLAAAILALARDGKLALDEPWRGKPFTLRQLLSHRAGVPNYGGLAEYHAAVARGDDAWPLEDLLARAGAKSLLFAPGTACAYSNIGYALLRREIEDQSGSDLGRAMQTLVFDPLGVRDVRMALTRADMQAMTWPGLRVYDPGWVYHGLAIGT